MKNFLSSLFLQRLSVKGLIKTSTCAIIKTNKNYETRSATGDILIQNAFFEGLNTERGCAILVLGGGRVIVEKITVNDCFAYSNKEGIGGAFDIEVVNSSVSGAVIDKCCISNCSSMFKYNSIFVETGKDSVNSILHLSVVDTNRPTTGFTVAQSGGTQKLEYLNETYSNTYLYYGFAQSAFTSKAEAYYINLANCTSMIGGSLQDSPEATSEIKCINNIICEVTNGDAIITLNTASTLITDSAFQDDLMLYAVLQKSGKAVLENCYVDDDYVNSGSVSVNNLQHGSDITISIDNSQFGDCYVEDFEKENQCFKFFDELF